MALDKLEKEEVIEIIQEVFQNFNRTDRYAFEKLIQILDGRNIQLGKTTGTKIGTATNQKFAFYNKTPIVQESANADTSGLTLANLEIEVNQLKQLLRNYGLMA